MKEMSANEFLVVKSESHSWVYWRTPPTSANWAQFNAAHPDLEAGSKPEQVRAYPLTEAFKMLAPTVRYKLKPSERLDRSKLSIAAHGQATRRPRTQWASAMRLPSGQVVVNSADADCLTVEPTRKEIPVSVARSESKMTLDEYKRSAVQKVETLLAGSPDESSVKVALGTEVGARKAGLFAISDPQLLDCMVVLLKRKGVVVPKSVLVYRNSLIRPGVVLYPIHDIGDADAERASKAYADEGRISPGALRSKNPDVLQKMSTAQLEAALLRNRKRQLKIRGQIKQLRRDIEHSKADLDDYRETAELIQQLLSTR